MLKSTPGLVALMSLASLGAAAFAAEPAPSPEPAAASTIAIAPLPVDDGYRGARGLITAQGMSGMFLNPTSGTLAQGQLTVQYCAMLYQNDGPNNTSHGLMVSYGVCDAFEIGAYGNYLDLNSRGDQLWVFGPIARVRLVKESQFIPEFSVGGLYLDGGDNDDLIARSEIFAAASKRFVLDEEGTFRAVRGHLGVRQIWREELPNITPANANAIPGYSPDKTATVGYTGVELELPYSLSAVAEVQTMDNFADHVPWAAGVQWKPSGVLGLSLAATQTQGEDHVGFYVGIGGVIRLR